MLDWVMPEMDGLETCRLLRRELPDARIVMYSSRLAADREPDALRAGADRYVEKGVDTGPLLEEVHDAIARSAERIDQ